MARGRDLQGDCAGERLLPLLRHRVVGAMPGSYEICPFCFWQDDGVRFRWPTMAGGANKASLIEAQRDYQDFGACDEHGLRYVRPPAEDEPPLGTTPLAGPRLASPRSSTTWPTTPRRSSTPPFWRVDAGRTYRISGTGLDWEVDRTTPWEHLVEESRTWSPMGASEASTGSNIFVAPT
ncbi:CPCC family cysteine-rich protein [Streptomyces sp. NPDC093088]|uniref:CPCC family cysteine-rich protein n=1 Tax=Streptomyces sp. NPDC093088 TaxID=3366023 RepID=UPI0037F698C9